METTMDQNQTIDQAYETTKRLYKFGLKHDEVVDRLCRKYRGSLCYSDCDMIATNVRRDQRVH